MAAYLTDEDRHFPPVSDGRCRCLFWTGPSRNVVGECECVRGGQNSGIGSAVGGMV
jgi:hypothetical protein